jgi:hypothetical protein
VKPQIILEKLIERLKQKLGTASGSQTGNAAWESEEDALYEHMRSGRGHWEDALTYAQEALTSNDPEKITDAAMVCPTFERTGNDLAASYKKRAERVPRIKGGATRGKQKAEIAKADWAPWEQNYKERIERGESPKTARQEVIKQMSRQEFTLTLSGEFPTNRSINRHLVLPK